MQCVYCDGTSYNCPVMESYLGERGPNDWEYAGHTSKAAHDSGKELLEWIRSLKDE